LSGASFPSMTRARPFTRAVTAARPVSLNPISTQCYSMPNLPVVSLFKVLTYSVLVIVLSPIAFAVLISAFIWLLRGLAVIANATTSLPPAALF